MRPNRDRAPLASVSVEPLRSRKLLDHLITWSIAWFLGLIGAPILIAVVLAPFQPQTAGNPGGVTPVLLPVGLGLTYGALATLRDEYGIPPAWRPSVTQGFVIAWYGGWSAAIALGVLRNLIDGGPALVQKWLGGDIVFWFVLVGLPWILATLHDRRRRGAAGWVDFS